MLFVFRPPTPFRDPEQYWADRHWVTPLSARGLDHERARHLTSASVNFSQSAWDADAQALYTWKKNHRGRDHIMRVEWPSLALTAVAPFPEHGRTPLLALDSRRRQLLVAQMSTDGLESLGGGTDLRGFWIYDLASGTWSEGELKGPFGLLTVSHAPKLDRFVALARHTETNDGQAWLIELDLNGTVLRSAATDLVQTAGIAGPSAPPPNNLGGNDPGLQSRIVDDTLLLVRWVDLGRATLDEELRWAYELFAIDVTSGRSRRINTPPLE